MILASFRDLKEKLIKIIHKYRWYGVVMGGGIVIILSLFRAGMQPWLSENPTPENLNNLNGNASQKGLLRSQEAAETDNSLIQDRTELLSHQKDNRITTILLIGVDNRPHEDYISNTDTLIVANVNQVKKQIALLSIPRDTQVMIGEKGSNKINSVARLGGSYNQAIKILEDLLGQKIDGYIISDFSGFKRMIDIIGGITVNVEKNMEFDTGDKTDGIINLKKGLQRLNGTQALQYARFRNDALADISRTVRQQTLLKALAAEMLQLKNIPKLPQLIPELYNSVSSDLSLLEMLSLSTSILRLNNYSIVSQTLPGKFVIEHEVSYWKVNAKESKMVTKDLFTQGKTSTMFSGMVEEEGANLPAKESSRTGAVNTNSNYAASKEVQTTIDQKSETEVKQNVIFEVLP